MMKKMICSMLAVLLLLLAACGNAEPGTSVSGSQPSASEVAMTAESTPASADSAQPSAQTGAAYAFSRDSFPVLDGSTSMVPLGKAIASVLLGVSEDDAADLISFNKTTQSLRNLMNGDCDLVIAAEPDSAVFDEMEAAGFQYESETIAREALVFVVNEDNPVDNLTSEQVRQIYSGEITNWSQVGGRDEEIAAFQRNQGAGSQVMMEKLVMGDTPMAEAPEDYVATEMGELISAVKSYDNTANAIGYTVYYYANDMKMADGLKIISIDGVQPDADTLRSETYPYLNGYYSFLPAQAEAGSPARMLYDWLVSPQGQYLLSLEGYVSVMDDPEQAYLSDSGNPVSTDFSQLAALQNGNLYTRLSEAPMEQLNAASDYGSIYPYAGVPLYESYTDEETGESGTYVSGWKYGFVTGDGVLITDPVYAEASRFGYYDTVGYHVLPLWQYCTVGDARTVSEDGYSWTEGDLLYGFAAIDGSFATGCIYEQIEGFDGYILAIRDSSRNLFDIYDLDGKLLLQSENLDFYDRFIPDSIYLGYGEDVFSIHLDDGDWFMTPDGELLQGPYSDLGSLSCGWAPARLAAETENSWDDNLFVNTDGEILEVPDTKYICNYFQNNRAVLQLSGGDYAVIDTEGNILLTTTDYPNYWNGCWVVQASDGSQTCYDNDMNLCFGGTLQPDMDYLSPELMTVRNDDGSLTLKNVETGAEITLENCDYASLMTDNATIYTYLPADDPADDQYILLDQELNLIYQGAKQPQLLSDDLTGQYYMTFLDYAQGCCDVDTMALEPVLENVVYETYPVAQNGKLLLSTASASEMYDADGTLVFRYCFFGGGESSE